MPGSGPLTEGPVPASAPAASRLLVLPVTTRRWVLTDNRWVVKLHLVYLLGWITEVFLVGPAAALLGWSARSRAGAQARRALSPPLNSFNEGSFVRHPPKSTLRECLVGQFMRSRLGVVKGPKFWSRKTKGRALILYNFELKNLRAMLDYEEATRALAHSHPP